MSSDTGIYILETIDDKGSSEFRVALLSAIENYRYSYCTKHNDWTKDCEECSNAAETDDQDVHIFNARKMWRDCEVFKDFGKALEEAARIQKDRGYTEYGIVIIHIDRVF
jgi:hypothetical protein